jgi:Uma2 family endonuclease
MSGPAFKRATYEDVLAAPPNCVAELVDGVLHSQPRPAGAQGLVATVLGEELGPPFRRGRGGPGGWIFVDEPELHLGQDVLVPDLAGWRRARMPSIENAPFFALAPDWVCEVLSPSTARFDKGQKLPVYAAHEVAHAWLVDPIARALDVYRRAGAFWVLVGSYADDARIRAEPLDAVEIELGALWADLAPEAAPRRP